VPCDACGRIPEITAPEAEQALDSATALASVEAKVLETEAGALLEAALAKWEEASRALHIARLQDPRDAARKALDEHARGHRLLAAALTWAEKAEDAAAAELAPQAEAVGKLAGAVKLATKMRHGVKAVAEASYLHDKASAALEPYRTNLAAAEAKRKTAAANVTASGARGDQLRKARDEARADLGNPGPAPVSPEAVIAATFRLLQSGKLDGDGAALELAGEIGRAICDLTGRAEEISAEARGALLAEQEQTAKGKALHLRNTPGGVVATPNPHSIATPQPYHPAQSPPHPVTPATTPGWPA
jgi:hypothetical protein